MELSSCLLGVLLGTALLTAFGSSEASDLYDVDPRRLEALWFKKRISPADPIAMKHTELQPQLRRLSREYPSAAPAGDGR